MDLLAGERLIDMLLSFGIIAFFLGVTYFTIRNLWWLHLETQKESFDFDQFKTKFQILKKQNKENIEEVDINKIIELIFKGQFNEVINLILRD